MHIPLFPWPELGDSPSWMHDRADEPPFPAGLADAVRRRRTSLGLKQVDLAELAGCSTRFVHAVEAGKATMRFDKLLHVLRVLGLRLQLEPAGGPADDRLRTRVE